MELHLRLGRLTLTFESYLAARAPRDTPEPAQPTIGFRLPDAEEVEDASHPEARS